MLDIKGFLRKIITPVSWTYLASPPIKTYTFFMVFRVYILPSPMEPLEKAVFLLGGNT